MEYYWELRGKNAQNIKTLINPLYQQKTVGQHESVRNSSVVFESGVLM